MLARATLVMFGLSLAVADARPARAELLGRWLWHGIDAEAVVTFQPDHTYISETTQFEFEPPGSDPHSRSVGTWQRRRNQLTVTWPDHSTSIYTIMRLTSRALVLHSSFAGTEKFTRLR